jgi:hypothetical protein
MVCRDLHLSDTPSDSDTELTVPLANDSIEEGKQDAVCAYCTSCFFQDHN